MAAATAPAPFEHSCWATAYLVLVCGLAQCGPGVGQAWLAPRLSSRVVVAELAGWNVGNAAVIAGTLLSLPTLGDAGGAVLVATLMVFARTGRPGRNVGWPLWTYRIVITGLLVSVVIGLALTHRPA